MIAAKSVAYQKGTIMFKVYVWEMDAWSGRKLDSIQEFDSKEEALSFVRKFNSGNTENTVPDWYMYAELKD